MSIRHSKYLLVSLLLILFALSINGQIEFIDFKKSSVELKQFNAQEIQLSLRNIDFFGDSTHLWNVNGYDTVNTYDYSSEHSSINFKENLGKISTDDNILIIVDTSHILPIKCYFYDFYIYDSDFDSTALCEGFPVYIYNSTDSNDIENIIDYYLELIQEARDTNGVWRPINYIYRDLFSCLSTESCSTIKPNSFMVTTIPKYYGNFKTELRVKFRNNGKIFYSNPYLGSINISQFEIQEEMKEWMYKNMDFLED